MEHRNSRPTPRHSPEKSTPSHNDPRIYWHALGKATLDTPQANLRWKRKARGNVCGDLLALLLVLAVAMFMLLGMAI